jgi:type VI secretion system secreted protein Hcp
MAFDAFLKIDGIDGDSTDSKHKDWIEIQSFSWGLERTEGPGGGPGGGAGRAVPEDAQFVAGVSVASPRLFQACAAGQHLREANLSVVRSGEQQTEFYKWRLTDVLVSSYHTAGDAGSDEVPADQFSLDFGRIEYSFRPQNADGSAGSPVEASWDFVKNTP